MAEHVAPPDGGWGWIVLVGAFVSYAIADGWSYSFGVVYPALLVYFQESRGLTALIAALLYGVPLLVSPIVCALTNLYGYRVVALIGGCITSVYFIGNAFAASVPQLCALTGILAGPGLAMVYIPALVVVTNYFEKRRGIATGLAVTGSGIGAFVFPIVVERLTTSFGWRGMMLLVAAIAQHLIAAGAIYRPLPAPSATPDQYAAVKQTEVNPEGGEVFDCPTLNEAETSQNARCSDNTENRTSCVERLRREISALVGNLFVPSLARHKPYLLFCVSTFVLYIAFSVPYVYLVDLVIESGVTNSDDDAVFLLSIIGISRTIGQLFLGYLGDRFRRLVIAIYTFTIIAAGAGTAVVPLLKSYSLLVNYAIVFGVGASATYVLQMVCLVELVGLPRSTSAFGIFQLVQGIATIAGTPLAGWLFDVTGRYDNSFYIAGSLIMVSGLMLSPLAIVTRRQNDN